MGWSYRGLGPFSPKSMESIDCVVFHQQLPDCDENSGSTWATNICQKSLWWFLDKGNVWTRDASSLRKWDVGPRSYSNIECRLLSMDFQRKVKFLRLCQSIQDWTCGKNYVQMHIDYEETFPLVDKWWLYGS